MDKKSYLDLLKQQNIKPSQIILNEQTNKRNVMRSKEIETVLKCGSLPKQYKNFVELFGDFEPLEIAGNINIGDYRKPNMTSNVIKYTLTERTSNENFPTFFIAISPVGNGDYWILNCKDGKVYLTSHEYIGYISNNRKEFKLSEYIKLYSKDFKSFILKREKEMKQYLQVNDLKKIKEILNSI